MNSSHTARTVENISAHTSASNDTSASLASTAHPTHPTSQVIQPPSPVDLSKHLTSLKTRLDFARFKLQNGWGKSTFMDIEMLWKRRQHQLIKEIPTPRFTQQDILDKRAQVPSARVNRAKKARLTRTYSHPGPIRDERAVDEESYTLTGKKKQSPYSYHSSKHASTTSPSLDMFHSHHPRAPPRKVGTVKVHHPNPHHSHPHRCPAPTRDFAPSPPHSQPLDDEYMSSQDDPPVKSSLDFLSYAIAMRERGSLDGDLGACSESGGHSSQPQPDISRIEPNLFDDDEDNTSSFADGEPRHHANAWTEHPHRTEKNSSEYILDREQDEESDEPSPPSSPVTAAAHAIMMFVNNHYTKQEVMYS